MKLTVHVIVHPEDDVESATVVREVFAVDRDALATDTLGWHLCEAQDLLAAVQDTMVTHQVSTALSAQVACPHCGAARRHKDSRPIVMAPSGPAAGCWPGRRLRPLCRPALAAQWLV